MNNQVSVDINGSQISGFFSTDILTNQKKYLHIFLGTCGLAGILGFFYYLFTDPVKIFGARVEPMAILVFGVLLVLCFVWFLAGITSLFSRPKANFFGMLLKQNEIEIGRIESELVDLKDHLDRITSGNNGKITRGKWNGNRIVDINELNLLFVFKQMQSKEYILSRLILSSVDKQVLEVKSHLSPYDTVTSISVISGGQFGPVGNLKTFEDTSINTLSFIQDLLNYFQINIKCAIQFLPVSVNPVNTLPFGLIGGLIKGSIESSKKDKMIEQFKTGTAFEGPVFAKFLEFITKNNWDVFVGEQKIEK